MLGFGWFFDGFSYDFPFSHGVFLRLSPGRRRQPSSARRRWSSYDASKTRRTRRPWRCRQQRWWPPLRCDTVVETGWKMAWLGSRIRLFYLLDRFFWGLLVDLLFAQKAILSLLCWFVFFWSRFVEIYHSKLGISHDLTSREDFWFIYDGEVGKHNFDNCN